MLLALEQAKLAYREGEAPIGAVIYREGEVISLGRNRRETEKNALCHAEIVAIDAACKKLGGWRLPGCEMMVTLEPCPMCAGAIINARIEKVIFGAYDLKAGSVESVVRLFDLPYNHKPLYEGGFFQEECAGLLSRFFREIRKG